MLKVLLLVTSAWVVLAHWRSAIRATVNEQGRGCSLRIRPWSWTCELALISWVSEAIKTGRLSQEAKGTGIPRVGSASHQCTLANRSFCSGFFYRSWHSIGSATNLLPWHGCLWLHAVSQTYNGTKIKEIQWLWHHHREYDEKSKVVSL